MRDYIIIFVVVILIFIGSFSIESYLKSSENKLVEKLDNIHGQIENGNLGQYNEIEDLENIWENTKNTLHLLVNHQVMDDIEGELKNLVQNYKMRDDKEIMLNIVELKLKIEDMHKGESFTLANIL